MTRTLQALVLILAIFLMGCGNAALQIQAATADAVADSSNAALPILVERYSDEGFRVLGKVKDDGGNQDDARAAIDTVKTKWAPIWKAWETLRIAHDGWSTAIESGGNYVAALVGLKNAYCALRAVWPEDIPAIPLGPLKCAVPKAAAAGPANAPAVP